jgi:dihydroxyacetone kinase
MAQFINARQDLVVEAIAGSLRAFGNARLARLDGFPHIKVVLRTDHRPERVAVISGGGSGHEPAHAGFVGEGMLTAAVCGDVFASPSVDAVLAAIMAVTGEGGCLLIVKNYTGDRLNFGLAAEKARARGKRVEMVIVADDIALPDHPQPRGVAGTLFVHKLAGYLAESGASLDRVASAARELASETVSLGMALNSCTVPSMGRDDRVPPGKAELGLGIHGEPGADLIDFSGARHAAALLSQKLFARVAKAGSYALLVNNLGSTTPLEMAVLADAMLASPLARKIRLVIGPAPLMTSLDMHGVSASLVPLSPLLAKALQADVGPHAWPGARKPNKPEVLKLPKEIAPPTVRASRNPALKSLVEKACDVLISLEADLNALDAKVGDGDTGTTITGAARHLKAELHRLPLADLGGFFEALGSRLAQSMGGSSGVLLAIFFTAAGSSAATGKRWEHALQAGLLRMMQYGGAALGDRTMVDALEPALTALASGRSLGEAARAARAGADATARMKRARVGRSSYVSADNLDGFCDPGAEAVARVFAALVGQGPAQATRRASPRVEPAAAL